MPDSNFKTQAINYNLAHHKTLAKISEPLKDFGITSVFYQRYYTNKTFSISSHHEWTKSFIENDIHDAFQNVINASTQSKSFTTATTITEEKAFLNALLLDNKFSEEKGIATKYFNILKHFNIHKIIASSRYHGDYVEIFGFATDKSDVNLDTFVINNPELITMFMLHFKDKAKNIINKQEGFFPSPLILNNQIQLADQKVQNFINATSFKRAHINYNSMDIYLSCKELSVLHHLSKGKTAKHIALDLGISPRTVEYHLDNIKGKAGLYNKSQLINLFHSKISIL